MTTVTQSTNEQMQSVRAWALDQLVAAQERFNRRPTGTHWQMCNRAMMVYQQVDWAVDSPHVDRVKLIMDLDEASAIDWGDIITRATLGMSVASALA